MVSQWKRLCIRHGVRKVNIDTDLRMAFIGSAREFLHGGQHNRELDPRKLLTAATQGMASICRARFEAFGSAGQASRIRPVACAEMARRYLQGELTALVQPRQGV